MALLGTVLLGDGVMLMGKGLLNFGVVLPVLIGLAALVLALRWDAIARWRRTRPRMQWLWRAGWIAFVLWVVSVAVFFRFIGSAATADTWRATTPAAVIVLGSGTPHCAISPTLKARLDTALALARSLPAMPAVPIVVSGGQDFGLQCAEADLMADYLIAQGLAPDRLIRESRSTSTDENLRFSRSLLAQHGVAATGPVVVVTSDFHLLRAERIARKAGFSSVTGVGAPTPLYLRYNAWLREYFAYISGWALGEY
ncbi:hypothetical protein CYJ10_15865 [Cupriavidus pauculus]|uniref:DUF218 domain-containing protein n=2 Tax=Cupriavidus pauculus TaxID=82633 RepID=A0A2N5CC71_9BURK|nr:hypothetical protein CYJ10_15865 [Cupriavidus pauculus]